MQGWNLGKESNPVMYSAKEWQKYRITLYYMLKTGYNIL